jgi:hypothetical protein
MQYEQLKARNANTLSYCDSQRHWLILLATDISMAFANTLRYEEVSQLADLNDPEQIMPLLMHRYTSYFGEHFEEHAKRYTQDCLDKLEGRIASVGLELIVQALRGLHKNSAAYNLSTGLLFGSTHNVAIELAGIEMDHAEQEKREFRQWHGKARNEQVDPLLAPEPNLAPAEKARRVRNGVSVLNDVGWLNSRNDYRDNVLGCSKEALGEAEEFFRKRPEISAGDVLLVLDVCATTMCEQYGPEPGDAFDEFWWERRGCSVSFVLSNFDKIKGHLEI